MARNQTFTVGVTKPREPDYGLLWLHQFEPSFEEAVRMSINEAFACDPLADSKDEFKALFCVHGHHDNLLEQEDA